MGKKMKDWEKDIELKGFHYKQELCYALGCTDSGKTVKRVERCPQTQEAWEEEAARKNCGDIPHSCSSFVCVMNTWRNETVEVCAPRSQIVGNYEKYDYQMNMYSQWYFVMYKTSYTFHIGNNCPEYNFLGTRIQRNEKVNCSKCPAVYNSTESYRCKILQGISSLS